MKSIQVSETASIYNDADIKALCDRVAELENALTNIAMTETQIDTKWCRDIARAALAASKKEVAG